MEKFLLFAYDNYYPAGGLDDLFGVYDSFDQAKNKADEIKNGAYRYDIVAIYYLPSVLSGDTTALYEAKRDPEGE